jgi:hypothetical protein
VAQVRVRGLRELIRAADAAGAETKKLVRGRLREMAQPVLRDARSRLGAYDAGSAARLGISVRRTGLVSVEQRARKVTGQRPDFGVLQMQRALIPALNENGDRIERGFEAAVDEIAKTFERS